MLTPHATPKVLIATTDLERLHEQLERQQDQLARAAALIAELWPRPTPPLMPRASKPCNWRGPNLQSCPNLQPCPDHAPKPWQRKTPRSNLSGSRQQQRSRYIIERDNGICHICGYAGADQADHVIPTSENGPDTVANMAAIHAKPCHQNKTAEEAARARARSTSA